MARVVKKVKKSNAQRRRMARIITASIFGVAVLVTGIILLTTFLRSDPVYDDAFAGEKFEEFRTNFQDLESFLEEDATQYVFVFTYNHKTFDIENEEYEEIFDRLLRFIGIIQHEENSDAAEDVTLFIINLNDDENYRDNPINSLLNNPVGVSFSTLHTSAEAGDFDRLTEIDNPRAIDGSDDTITISGNNAVALRGVDGVFSHLIPFLEELGFDTRLDTEE